MTGGRRGSDPDFQLKKIANPEIPEEKRAYPEFPKNLDCQLVQNRHNTYTIKLLLTELYTVTIGCLVLFINFNFSV